MPGLNVFASARRLDEVDRRQCGAIQSSMLHRDAYRHEVLFEGNHVCVGSTAYKHYPIRTLKESDTVAWLEGLIYNKTDDEIERGLLRILGEFRLHDKSTEASVEEFVGTADGEFLVVAHETRGGRTLVFNDSMGRLPTYFHYRPGVFVLGREAKFVLPFLESVKFSRSGLLEYLLFGFTFGQNTLLDAVSYLSPGSAALFSPHTGTLTTHRRAARDFSLTRWPPRRQVVDELRDRFLGGMANRVTRVHGTTPVVSLSGGLDSRGTLAGLVAVGATPLAVTIEGPEQQYALRAAAALGVEARGLPKPAGTGTFDRIVFWKDGLDCHPGLEDLYGYPESIRAYFGDEITYFTGIYGGEITRYRNPTSSLSSTRDLAQYLLSVPDVYKYSTEPVSKLLGRNRSEILRHLEQHVGAYPEQSPYRKYIRFRHEFDIKYAGEAEDRNRFYFWTITPYFSLSFFEYVMSLEENKKDTLLFRDFLYAIDPRTCEVGYFNFRVPMKYRPLLYGLSAAERLARVPVLKALARRALRARNQVRHAIAWKGAGSEAGGDSWGHERNALKNALNNSAMLQNVFDLKRTATIIGTERDTQGLERLRIVFSYALSAAAWYDRHRRLQDHS